MRRSVACGLGAMLLACLARDTAAVDGPADVVVYANKVPAQKSTGGAFENPFDEGSTRIVVEPITSPVPLRYPKGASGWGLATWAKYVFLANYEEGAAGAAQPPYVFIDDQRMGVFDTELRRFCEIDVDPAVAANATVSWIGIAEPTARKTRVYFIGYVSSAPLPDPPYLPAAFGYVEADLDRDPCQPYDPGSATAGWHVVGFTAKNLNDKAAAASLPYPCDHTCIFGCRNWCDWDGMSVLDRNTVVVGNWLGTRISAIRVADDPGGANPLDLLSVPAVYPLPFWQPGGPGTGCYLMRPVNRAAVDYTRTDPNDRRFTWAFDVSCIGSFPGCGSCVEGGYGVPVQEYRFNASAPSITATSPFFQAVAPGAMRSPTYDHFGNLWTSESSPADVGVGPNQPDVELVIYKKTGNEHAYYQEGNGGGSAIVPPNNPSTDVIPYGPTVWQRVLGATESGALYYKGVFGSVQRAHFLNGEWAPEDPSSYERFVGQGTLPAEPTNCEGSTPVFGAPFAFPVVVGGSPPSLWSTSDFFDPGRHRCITNRYLMRIPVGTPVPDGAGVVGRPGLAWDSIGQRLWMTRQQNGVMQVRVREEGFWSSWVAMPTAGIPAGVSIASDGSILTDGTGLLGGPIVEVIARGSDGKIYNARLVSSLTCAVATCQWGTWSQLPALPFGNTAADDVAAVYQNAQQATVAVRSTTGDIWVAKRDGISTAWYIWKKLKFLSTATSPSMAWNPIDGYAWVVANNAGDPARAPKYRKISGDDPVGGWTDVQNTLPAGVTSWSTAPAIAFDGTRMRVFEASGQAPPGTYQTILGASWSAWRRTSTKEYAVRQPAVANVSGDVNLVTIPYSGIMNEQAME